MTPRTNSYSSDDESMGGICCNCNDGLASLTIDSTTSPPPLPTSSPPPPLDNVSMLPPPPLPPPTPIEPGKYQEFLEQWSSDIQSYIQSTLVPQLIDNVVSNESIATFVKSCTAVQTAIKVQTDAEQILQELQKTKDISPEIIQQAQQNVKDAQSSTHLSTETCQDIATRTILQPLDSTFLSTTANDFDDTVYILYLVLHPFNLPKIVAWCNSSEANGTQLVASLLEPNTPLLRKMMESGGASNGQYGRAIQIYYQLQSILQQNTVVGDDNEDVTALLQRLQFAVALEHAEPIGYFGTPSQHVDPIQRYKHYRDAFLLNELDEHFIQFNVWELRQVVNSDATDAELQWGRQSLMAYRPDLVLLKDPLWNYCTIVRTDVNYATPDWYKSPRSYDQILSGGGKCGPRAWYGRFICKAFGIPTWGVRQPGHAAMTRWTTYGWDVCLGGGMWKSWWDDQGGLDFVLETKARVACTNELVFLQKVYRLQWLAQYYHKEKSDVVRRNGQYDPNNPWLTLGMIRRQQLAIRGKVTKRTFGKNQLERMSLYDAMTVKSNIRCNEAGATIIPAVSCLPSNKAIIAPSFLGGQQLFVKEDAELVYEINSSKFEASSTPMTYFISCTVATAHRSEQSISVTVNNKNTYSILMPYTMALWGETEPVSIVVDVVSSPIVTFRFKRPQQNFGFAFVEFKLSPA